MAFTFSPNESGWPVKAERGGAAFIFSGTFDSARIAGEARRRSARKLRIVVLGAIGVLGLLAFVLNLVAGFQQGQFLPIFNHNFYNLIFWVSLLADFYLWATLMQDRLAKKSLSLLEAGKTTGPVDVYRLFSPNAQAAWDKIAASSSAADPGLVSVLQALLTDSTAQLLFLRLGIGIDRVKESIQPLESSDAALVHQLPFAAVETADRLRSKTIDPIVLLVALFASIPTGHPLQTIVVTLDLAVEKVEAVAAWIIYIQQLSDELNTFSRLARFKSDKGTNAGLTAVPTPYLDQFSQDLTLAAKYGKLPISKGREADLEDILALLSEGKRNVVVKGQLGTGRSTVIHELAQRMVTENVPRLLQDKRLVQLEVSAIVGSKLPAEQVLVNALQEADKSGNIVLALEDLHVLG